MRRSAFAVVWLSGVGVASANPSALDKPAFTASASELLAAAGSAPAGDWPVVVLRSEAELGFDDQAREIDRRRAVFVVRSRAALDRWGTLQVPWDPSHHDRPSIRARVVEPGGTVIDLDPAGIADSPIKNGSNRRYLEARLPALDVGVVVEQEVVWRDRQPVFASGAGDSIRFDDSVPIQSTRASISAPAARKAHYLAHNLPPGLKVDHRVAAGRETWTFTAGAIGPGREREPFTPGDVRVSMYAAVALATSWNAIARDYRKLIDQRISDGAIALAAELPRTPTVDSARAIVAWLHRNVRSTGVDCHAGATVPATPAETLKRGTGDCIDLATLLVALLRQATMRADVALIDAGPGADVDRELPEIGGFDRAIVRVQLGPRTLWIDPADALAAVGALPVGDQGRLALVAADATAALVATPVATDNLLREVRTFELAEYGPSRVTEVSQARGTFEAEDRAWLRDADAAGLRKDLGDYVEAEYDAKTLERYATTDVRNLAVPLELTVVAASCERASTDRDRIEVALSPRDVLDRAPALVRATLDEPRRADFVWPSPHVYEIENRLVIPIGFTIPTPSPERVRKLGTATLTERHRIDGRTYIVTFRFESGKPRLTAAELTALVAAVHDLDHDGVRIVLEQTAMALASRGKPRDALDELGRLIQLHPKEALHRIQLAIVLAEAGMGDAARRAVRKAVELEPTNAEAYSVLGWVLRRDSLGRQYGYDHDRAGALAAYQQARKLAPSHFGAIVDHATLLERDPRGFLYGPGSDVTAAIAARRAALALHPDDDDALALMRALLAIGRFTELEELARTAKSSPARDALLIAAIAAGPRGRSAAEAEVARLAVGAGRTTLIDSAAGTAFQARHYDVARALYAITGTLKPATPTGEMVRRIKRVGAARKPNDPVGVAMAAMRLVVDPTVRRDVFLDADVEQELRRALGPVRMTGPATSPALYDDVMATAVDWYVDGGARGPWRVRAEIFGHKESLYVALDGNVAKLLGELSATAGVGRYALRRLAANDTAAATVLLDWARADVGTTQDKFAAVWDGPRDKDSIELAAALLAAGTGDRLAIPILARCATSIPSIRETCDTLLAAAYARAEQWKDAELHATAWEQRHPGAALATIVHVRALIRLGRVDDADKLLGLALARTPDDVLLVEQRAYVALARGHGRDALAIYDGLAAKPSARTASVENTAAWLRAADRVELDRALALATSAAGTNKNRASAPYLDTLAAVEAERGDIHAARDDDWKASELGLVREPEPSTWYVFGRIAEQLALRDDAIAMYRRVTGKPGVVPGAYDLAQRRLKALQP